MRLAIMFDTMGVVPESLDKAAKMKLSTWQTFLLIRLVSNLKGSQVDSITSVFLTLHANERLVIEEWRAQIFNFTCYTVWVPLNHVLSGGQII